MNHFFYIFPYFFIFFFRHAKRKTLQEVEYDRNIERFFGVQKIWYHYDNHAIGQKKCVEHKMAFRGRNLAVLPQNHYNSGKKTIRNMGKVKAITHYFRP